MDGRKLLGAVGLAVGGTVVLIVMALLARHQAPAPPEPSREMGFTEREPAGSQVVYREVVSASGDGSTSDTVRILPGQVLATVNLHAIKLADLVPLHSTGEGAAQAMSRGTYEYLLRRAVDRELILQTARAQGVELNNDQKQHLARVRAAREQREPGRVAKLNLDQAQLDFEMRDAEAFLLQTALLARKGFSPNVTPEQVQAYYQAHAAEYGDLPPEGPARQEAWAKIDYNIRQQLAGTIRTWYDTELTNYMEQLKATAQVVVSPLPVAGEAE